MFGIRFHGRLTRQDMIVLRAAVEGVAAEHPRSYLLTDMQGSTGIDAAARKYMADWSREPDLGLVGTAVYGTGFMMRTLVTLTLNAIKLLGHLNSQIHFFKDEAEARRWVAAHRAGSSEAPPTDV